MVSGFFFIKIIKNNYRYLFLNIIDKTVQELPLNTHTETQSLFSSIATGHFEKMFLYMRFNNEDGYVAATFLILADVTNSTMAFMHRLKTHKQKQRCFCNNNKDK